MNTYFFIFLSIAVTGVIGAIINFVFAARGKSSMGGMFIGHAIAACFYVIGGVGSVVTGIMWALQYLKS